MNPLVVNIWQFLHFFHKPFSKVISQQQFRYLACGSFLALLDVAMFYILNNLILHQADVHLIGYSIKSYYFSLWTLTPINLFLGFSSSKYIVFPGSHLPHGAQLFRYMALVVIAFFLNNVILNFFIQQLSVNSIVSKLSTTLIIACFSYVWQRFLAFRKKKEIIPG